jgi:hypothetical protein
MLRFTEDRVATSVIWLTMLNGFGFFPNNLIGHSMMEWCASGSKGREASSSV